MEAKEEADVERLDKLKKSLLQFEKSYQNQQPQTEMELTRIQRLLLFTFVTI